MYNKKGNAFALPILYHRNPEQVVFMIWRLLPSNRELQILQQHTEQQQR